MLNLSSDIIAYENGELSEDEVIALFQELIDTGLAWQLQGSYGRFARDLITAGLVHPPCRIGYRCDTGFQYDGTALGIVNYEECELGNDLHVPFSIRLRLADIPASAVAWICLTKPDALRYGTVDDLYQVKFDEVIGRDDEGGYLVVIREETHDQAP